VIERTVETGSGLGVDADLEAVGHRRFSGDHGR
jgi:hypothetical protein